MESKDKWEKVLEALSARFAPGEKLDISGILFLIGVQECGKINTKFKKDEKLELMHVAICRVLEPYGHYTFEGYDADGWPHYQLVEDLPSLKPGEQSYLMKNAILQYFEENGFINS